MHNTCHSYLRLIFCIINIGTISSSLRKSCRTQTHQLNALADRRMDHIHQDDTRKIRPFFHWIVTNNHNLFRWSFVMFCNRMIPWNLLVFSTNKMRHAWCQRRFEGSFLRAIIHYSRLPPTAFGHFKHVKLDSWRNRYRTRLATKFAQTKAHWNLSRQLIVCVIVKVEVNNFHFGMHCSLLLFNIRR